MTRVIAARSAAGHGEQVLWQADDGSEANRLRLLRDAAGQLRYIVTASGAEQVKLTLGAVADSTDFTVAVRVAADSFAGCLNGGSVVAARGGAPSVTTERWGGATAAGAEWFGTISADIEFPAALTDAALQALSQRAW